ncbi:serine/threonine-protein kinase [Spongiactinospora sp. TRM90649]|uniref:serine/threonine-protein kinase n=1 Tax=Spongiactinospora sp. TRM90649 TaxID=3031114 RepID=UPI0023F6D4A5|nr:serine/threonine-protein kinase [Spongiactinospora sp. TRM90649]MDF5755353.1 serine/threonine-protein kinase [Spongiactinospora sp. TRM90649]
MNAAPPFPAPLQPGDPALVGGYRITGRLGSGGQGVVYLGEGDGGRRVAVKVIRADLEGGDTAGALAKEIGLARRVKAFCTAQVLDTGESGGVPYIVSEFVDGPSLARVIKEHGPVRGAELRRVAIGTLTALAAIHQAGVVHQDFKPGNVLLSREGPRVIDFGISRALDATEPAAEGLVGTPPFMAPEQFAGQRAGPPADLFAWASTIVCAATGRPPFGGGALPVVIGNILNGRPELGDLDGELRDLVLRCLAKDPAERPTATRALLALLGHPVPEVRLLAEGRESAAPPPRRRRTPVVVAAVTAVLALAVAAGFFLLRPPDPPVPVAARTSAPPPPLPRGGRMPETSTSELTLPDTALTLHENAADPVWVSTYVDRRDQTLGWPSYLRDPRSRRFAYYGGFQDPVASPGGAYVAALSGARLTRSDFETIRLTDRLTGQDVQIRTVTKPKSAGHVRWRGDGRALLLTIYPDARAKRTEGFIVVDPAARTARAVPLPQGHDSAYLWGPDGETVLHQAAGDAVAVLDLGGKVLRTFPGVGALIQSNATTTTAGTVFATTCPDVSGENVCLWDAATGTRRAKIDIPERARVHGWLDDRHLLATVPGERRSRVVMLDLRGRAVRTLAEAPPAELDDVVLWFTAK